MLNKINRYYFGQDFEKNSFHLFYEEHLEHFDYGSEKDCANRKESLFVGHACGGLLKSGFFK